MRIAITQIDGKWPNLALAKIAAWHKACGDETDWFSPLRPADITYASKVFLDTPDNPYLPLDTRRGGAGYDSYTKLGQGIERMKPDWSLWPEWDRDMGFTTRGCIRKCGFCSVHGREGNLHVVADLEEISTGRREMVLLDANITAAPIEHLRRVTAAATRLAIRLDYSQGLDARLLTDEQARLVVSAPHKREFHIAFDHVRDENAVRRAIKLFQAAGLDTRHDLMVFVLVGFDTTEDEDLYRIELVRDLGAVPFVMRYDRSDLYQQKLARWCNRASVFRSCSWDEYRHNKNDALREPEGQLTIESATHSPDGSQ